MIRSLFNSLGGLGGARSGTQRLFLTRRQFDREVARERLRATRRGIAFCIITLKLPSGSLRMRQSGQVRRLLLRNLRSTDEKAMFGTGEYAVLLVDTPEMGGRTVLDRLQGLFEELSLSVKMELKVHDPQGFDSFEQGGPNDKEGALLQLPAAASVSRGDQLVERPRIEAAVKRVIDLVGAGMGIICCGPILLMAMIAVRLSSPGPVFFRQTREGLWGKPFTIYKLRTMVDQAEKLQEELRQLSHRDGPAFKIDRDPRVTGVGRVLRATCLDELPQLWNVLKGEMSLVGPRPLPWQESRACNHWQRRRLDVLPGLTCFWQVDKARAETFDDWMRMDLNYVDHGSLWVDAALVYRTLAVAFSGRGNH